MLKNFIKTAWRNLIRDKVYITINIIGLSIGIAASLLIILYIINELSYDQFHKDSDKIYRIYVDGNFGPTRLYSPLTSNKTKQALLDEFGEIESATRFFKRSQQFIKVGSKKYTENHVFFADKDFFKVFNFNLIAGNANKALDGPGKIVLTQSMAKKYFGEQNPINKILIINHKSYKVSGICEDVPANSHFHFNLLASYASSWYINEQRWINSNIYTYFKIYDKQQAKDLEVKLSLLVEKYVGPEVEQFMHIDLEKFEEQGNQYSFRLQSIEKIHLYSDFNDEIEPGGNINNIYYFSSIAFFILIIACINFMNLATAKYSNRAKEVGIRKVIGSHKKQLIFQFLTESVLLSLFSLIVAMVLVELSLPLFNQLANKNLSFPYLNNWYTIPLLLLFVMIIGVFSGSYPAFHLSKFSPLKNLKRVSKSGSENSRLRRVLVVIQFTITMILFISTSIIFHQNKFMLNKKLGFAKEQILLVDKLYLLGDQKDAFTESIEKIPTIHSAALSHKIPGSDYNGTTLQINNQNAEEMIFFAVNYVGPKYIETMDLELLQGNNFEEAFGHNSNNIIINETAVKNAHLDDPIGQFLTFGKDKLKIVGVVKDYHFESLHKPIRPLLLHYHNNYYLEYLVLRVNMDEIQNTIQQIRNVWKEFEIEEPFNYIFLDQNFDHLYKNEQRTARIFVIFSILAIIIACMGLIGLSAFTTEKRSKEICIRKVMGARLNVIVRLLYKEIFYLLAVTTIIAWPLSYYLMTLWLQHFAFKINLSITPFLTATCLVFLIAICTTSFQAFKAAHTNPINKLRYE